MNPGFIVGIILSICFKGISIKFIGIAELT